MCVCGAWCVRVRMHACMHVSVWACLLACLAGITSKHCNVLLDPKKSRLLVQDPIVPCSWTVRVFARHKEPKGTLNHASIHMISRHNWLRQDIHFLGVPPNYRSHICAPAFSLAGKQSNDQQARAFKIMTCAHYPASYCLMHKHIHTHSEIHSNIALF